MHGRSRMTIDPLASLLCMLERSTSGFYQPGRHCLQQARSAVRCSASHTKGELHLHVGEDFTLMTGGSWMCVAGVCRSRAKKLSIYFTRARTTYMETHIIKIKIHSSCETEDFVETHLCKLCVILRSRVLRVVCPH